MHVMLDPELRIAPPAPTPAWYTAVLDMNVVLLKCKEAPESRVSSQVSNCIASDDVD